MLNKVINYIKENNLDAEIELVGGLCQDKCSTGPNIYIDDVLHSEMNEEKLKEILQTALV